MHKWFSRGKLGALMAIYFIRTPAFASLIYGEETSRVRTFTDVDQWFPREMLPLPTLTSAWHFRAREFSATEARSQIMGSHRTCEYICNLLISYILITFVHGMALRALT
jgi:hypothetical protein